MTDLLAHAASFHYFGRDALYALFRALGYPSGTPVWAPSFHCGVEVRAAADAGFAPHFYRVREDLTVDEDDLARALREAPGPSLIIHYFGFAQPATARVAALCRRAGVPLIEDCSHALLSSHEGRALGAFGSAAIFSLYKILGTVEGGALRADAEEIARSTGRTLELPRPPRPVIAWEALRDAIHRARRDAPVNASSEDAHEILAARFDRRIATARERIFNGPWCYGRGISLLSLALIRRMDAVLIRERRRKNYIALDAMLRGIPAYEPVYEGLPDDTCPLYLPIYVPRRTEVLLRLQKAAIQPFIFGMFSHPAMNSRRFPECERFREKILCLPIHQDLNERELKRIAAELTGALRA
jgi:dTDP-4-amino-4,6-dideoxygalactose transaminase